MSNSTNEISNFLSAPFLFRQRPSALPGNYRPHRRVSLLLLIVDRCYGGRATLEQLHVIDWACRSAESREHFRTCLSQGRAPDIPCVRIDPTVNRAVDWASGADLVIASTAIEANDSRALQEYRVWLTPRGKAAVEILDSIPDCLVLEKMLLADIGHKVTQAFVQPFLRWGLSW